MRTSLARFDEVLHEIYDAALLPERWPSALAGISRLTNAPRGLLFTPHHGPAQGGFVVPHDIPQASLELWAAKSMLEDPFLAAAIARGYVREGVAADGATLVPDEVLFATPFYRELWAPLGIARVCSGAVFDGTDARKIPTVLAVYRHRTDPKFTSQEVEVLRRLIAHASRALGVMFHLRDRQFQVAASIAALDRLPAGVLLVDGQQGVQFANPAATRQLAAADPLRLLQVRATGATHRLAPAARLHHLEAPLRRAIADALAPLAKASVPHFSQAMVLPDAEGRPACVLHAAPLGQAERLLGEPQARAILFLYDLKTAAALPPQRLRDLFGFTPAEARAALEVLKGGSAEAMAQRLGVSVNTLRTQLQAAYSKSRTHRQTDFLKLLLALASE